MVDSTDKTISRLSSSCLHEYGFVACRPDVASLMGNYDNVCSIDMPDVGPNVFEVYNVCPVAPDRSSSVSGNPRLSNGNIGWLRVVGPVLAQRASLWIIDQNGGSNCER